MEQTNLVAACVENVYNLRIEEKFCDTYDQFVAQFDAHSRQARRDNTLLQDYVVQEFPTCGTCAKISTRRP